MNSQVQHDHQTIRIGARGSKLSLWQAQHVQATLQKAWPHARFEVQVIQTKGDVDQEKPIPEIGSKGVFTFEIEEALRQGNIEFAVHSQKDLPIADAPGVETAAVLLREDVRDALISKNNYTLSTLPKNAQVGTSSTRRAAQLLRVRPDLKIINLRGNADTRLKKAFDPDGPYDAIVAALAGLVRLGQAHVISEALSFVHAPAQGAIAVQCRAASPFVKLLAPVHHEATFLATHCERAFLAGMGGGCSMPIAAGAEIEDGSLKLVGCVVSPDGQRQWLGQDQIPLSGHTAEDRELALHLGYKLAEKACHEGAEGLLKPA